MILLASVNRLWAATLTARLGAFRGETCANLVREEDLSKGLLETIDMDSYRAEKKATIAILLADADAEIEPVPTSGSGA